MKGYELSMTEKEKMKTIQKVVKDKLTIKRAAIIAGLTEKRIKQLVTI